MFYREHGPPHFHATYGEHHVIVEIERLVAEGDFPPRAVGLVLAWARLHRVELAENWERARAGESLRRIPPWSDGRWTITLSKRATSETTLCGCAFKTARRVRCISHLSWKGPSSNRFATRSFSSSSEWMRSSTRLHGPTGPTLPRSAYIVLPQSKQTLEPHRAAAREYGGDHRGGDAVRRVEAEG